MKIKKRIRFYKFGCEIILAENVTQDINEFFIESEVFFVSFFKSIKLPEDSWLSKFTYEGRSRFCIFFGQYELTFGREVRWQYSILD